MAMMSASVEGDGLAGATVVKRCVWLPTMNKVFSSAENIKSSETHLEMIVRAVRSCWTNMHVY